MSIPIIPNVIPINVPMEQMVIDLMYVSLLQVEPDRTDILNANRAMVDINSSVHPLDMAFPMTNEDSLDSSPDVSEVVIMSATR